MNNEALERPSLKQFVSTKATTKDINSMFLNNTELYSYIAALDAYCDELESKLREGKPVADTASTCNLQSVSGSAWDAVKKIPQVPQTQAALIDQLNILRTAANKLGLYDAADFLNRS